MIIVVLLLYIDETKNQDYNLLDLQLTDLWYVVVYVVYQSFVM